MQSFNKTPFVGTIRILAFPQKHLRKPKMLEPVLVSSQLCTFYTFLAVHITIFLFLVHLDLGSKVCGHLIIHYYVCLFFSGILLPNESAERPNQTDVRPGSSKIAAAVIRPKTCFFACFTSVNCCRCD